MLSAGCPCGISRFSLHPAAQRTRRSLLQGTARAGRASAQGQWAGEDSVVEAIGVTSLCAAMPLGSRGKPSRHLWTLQRDAEGRCRP